MPTIPSSHPDSLNWVFVGRKDLPYIIVHLWWPLPFQGGMQTKMVSLSIGGTSQRLNKYTGFPLTFLSNSLPFVSFPIYLMRTVFPFLAIGPVPILASRITMSPARVFLAFSFFSSAGFGVSSDFLSFFSFFFFFSFFSFFSSVETSTGFPSSAFCFLFLFSTLVGPSVASDSRARFWPLPVSGSSVTSSKRLWDVGKQLKSVTVRYSDAPVVAF